MPALWLSEREWAELMNGVLERFGPEAFQDLVSVLLLKEFGPAAQRMGRGPDGGRDIVMQISPRGKVDGLAEWTGYTVFQVKHKSALIGNPSAQASWLRAQIREEIAMWARPDTRRDRVPDSIVFVTNVPLTPAPGAGGFDTVMAAIESHLDQLSERVFPEGDAAEEYRRRVAALRETRWRVWDANQVNALVETHESVRRAFPAFLTAADVFAYFRDQPNHVALENLGDALRSQARSALLAEGNVYFDEAGDVDAVPHALHEVIVDLPVLEHTAGGEPTLLGRLLGRSERMLRPGLTAHSGPRHLIVTGAPGNGKTTISRFIVQAFRAAYLEGSSGLSERHRRTIHEIRGAFRRLGIGFPSHRRWPFRLDLGAFAAVVESDAPTIIQRVAKILTDNSEHGVVSASALRRWITEWPCLLVLDGLDEVTDPPARKRIIERIIAFVEDLEAEGGDLLVVLTTRPMGYTESILPSQFERLDLGVFEPSDALEYGEKAIRVRLGADSERIEKVVSRLRNSAADPARAHLMRTPLQVLMLTIILDSGRALPPYRYGLFWSYYLAVRTREQGKPGSAGDLLRDHQNLIDRVHELAGFALHCLNEEAQASDAGLSEEGLLEAVWAALDEYGFEPDGEDAGLAGQIVAATKNRLVLLTPRPKDGVLTFDVRSLQELMAAREITHGPWRSTERKLRVAAASPHWRNAWIFAAGQTFFESRPQPRNRLTELVEDIDTDAHHRLSAIAPIAPALSLDLLDDGMSRNAPRWRDRLLAIAARVFEIPHDSDLPLVMSTVVRVGDHDPAVRTGFVNALAGALRGDSVASESARSVINFLRDESRRGSLGATGRSLLALEKETSMLVMSPSGWPLFDEVMNRAAAASESPGRIEEARALVRKAQRAFLTADERSRIVEFASDPTVSKPLNDALLNVASQYSIVVRELRKPILDTVHRGPVAVALEAMQLEDRTP